jgi:glycosyltransferase involved in cell wall biosynthesis
MKILFVSNISWSLYNFRRGFMAALRERGHDVVFCASPDEYSSRLESLGFRFIPVEVDRKGTSFTKDFCLLKHLYRVYSKEKPGIIFHNSIKPNIYGALAAKSAGIRCVNTVSGLGYVFLRKGLQYYLVKFLYWLACMFAEKTFFQNKDDLQLFLEKRIVSPRKTALVKGSGVNTDLFDPSYCAAVKKDTGSFVFSFIGRILWDKGIGEFIEACRNIKQRYPQVRIDLLGMIDKGNPAAVTKAQIEAWEHEGLLKYRGETDDVRPFICESDCVVLPSYREGTPKALLEAAAMEKPIITTDAVGCREVADDRISGFIVPVRDPLKLQEAMQRIIELPLEKRLSMGSRGREKVLREFSEKAVIETYCRELKL